MSDVDDRMRRGINPFLATEVDDRDGIEYPIHELKFGLVLYTDSPPGPRRAAAVFDLYVGRYPGRLQRHLSTAPGSDIEYWDSNTEQLFRTRLLPNLRKTATWGYAFDDGREIDNHLFMFHGYRPVTQAGKASFFRFEFPWNVDPDEVRRLAVDVATLVPFSSGFAGWFCKPSTELVAAYDEMYAVCRRFWGIEAWNLDMTVDYVLDGYLSVNWLTLIGDGLRRRDPEAVAAAERAATWSWSGPHGVILQAGDQPVLGDQNRQEPMPVHQAVAQALAPLQLQQLDTFGGDKWDEYNSLAWARRFTDPQDF